MKEIPPRAFDFFKKQHFVIVATIDRRGFPHSSCKGIVDIKEEGRIYLLDLYKLNTYRNLKHNPSISLTAVDEEKFAGYCLKGHGKIVNLEEKDKDLLSAWNKRLVNRITKRILGHIRKDRSSLHHPEADFPHPEYLILVEIEEIINLVA